jgi:hypothetical protein
LTDGAQGVPGSPGAAPRPQVVGLRPGAGPPPGRVVQAPVLPRRGGPGPEPQGVLQGRGLRPKRVVRLRTGGRATPGRVVQAPVLPRGAGRSRPQKGLPGALVVGDRVSVKFLGWGPAPASFAPPPWRDCAPQQLLRIHRPCRRRRRSPPPQGPTSEAMSEIVPHTT